MNILEDYFSTTYPIHVRRADLAKLRKSNWMSNSEFADLYIQKCNEAQVLGRSAANTDCGNCIELHKLNASNCAALLDDVNLRGRLLEDPNLDADNIVEKIVAYEATRKTGQNRNSGTANSARSNNRGNNNSCLLYTSPSPRDRG